MDHAAALRTILINDSQRFRILGIVWSLGLPDCWVGAGFVRNAVWDYLHHRVSECHEGDVDVLWFAPERIEPSEDSRLEVVLRTMDPTINWSVRNQARMHQRNGDAPYASATDAMRYWPRTATAVAARLTKQGDVEIAAPLGLDDLLDLIVRPAGRFAGDKYQVFRDRVIAKGWLNTWPLLRMQRDRAAIDPSPMSLGST